MVLVPSQLWRMSKSRSRCASAAREHAPDALSGRPRGVVRARANRVHGQMRRLKGVEEIHASLAIFRRGECCAVNGRELRHLARGGATSAAVGEPRRSRRAILSDARLAATSNGQHRRLARPAADLPVLQRRHELCGSVVPRAARRRRGSRRDRRRRVLVAFLLDMGARRSLARRVTRRNSDQTLFAPAPWPPRTWARTVGKGWFDACPARRTQARRADAAAELRFNPPPFAAFALVARPVLLPVYRLDPTYGGNAAHPSAWSYAPPCPPPLPPYPPPSCRHAPPPGLPPLTPSSPPNPPSPPPGHRCRRAANLRCSPFRASSRSPSRICRRKARGSGRRG